MEKGCTYLRWAILFISLFTTNRLIFAQGENNNWHFGISASLTFNNGSPALDNPPNAFTFGSGLTSSISDSLGNLLFYSSGSVVYNKFHQVMPNSNQLCGLLAFTATIKNNYVPNRYFLFTLNQPPVNLTYCTTAGLYYSIIDMTLDNGKGDVLPGFKNIFLLNNAIRSLTVIQHANKIDHWLIAVDNQFTYYVYLVNQNGITLNTQLNEPGLNIMGFERYMSSSKKGNYFLSYSPSTRKVLIFNFNNITGSLQFNSLLDFASISFSRIESIEFSPNDSLIYIPVLIQNAPNVYYYTIRQYYFQNLLNNQLNNFNTFYIDSAFFSNMGNTGALGTYMRTGPDNKLYYHTPIINQVNNKLKYIINPDLYLVNNNFSIWPFYVTGLLANHYPHNFGFNMDAIQYRHYCLGDTTQFRYNFYLRPDSVLWNFGDPGSGLQNTSRNRNPSHIYNAVGNYTVTLTVFKNGQTHVRTRIIEVQMNPIFNLGSDTSFCQTGNQWTYQFGPGTNYLWQDSSTQNGFTPQTTGWYWLQAQNGCGTFRDSVFIQIHQPLAIQFSDTSLCNNISQTISLNLAPMLTQHYDSLRWNTNSQDTNIIVNQSGLYAVNVFNACGVFGDTLQVNFHQNLQFNPPQPAAFCFGDSVLLHVQGGYDSLFWNNQKGMDSLWVKQAGWIHIKAYNQCNQLTDSIEIEQDLPLMFSLGNDTGICNNNPVTLQAPSQARTVVWSNGSNQNTITINQTGTYWLQAGNSCGTKTDTVTFTYINDPQVFLGNDTLICLNDTLHLDAFFPHSTYLWQDGSTNADFHASQAGNYWVEVTNLCNQETDSIWIQVAEKPQINLPNEILLCDGEVFTSDYNQAFTSYQWNDGNNSGIRNIQEKGVYTLQASNQCGSKTQSITINTDNTPNFTIGEDSLWCEEWFGVEQIGPMFDNNNAGQGWIYLWNDGSTKSGISPQEPGEYWLEASNPCGTGTDSIKIGIKNCNCVVYVPNAFTPNADGWNEEFQLKTTCPLMSYNIKIFNRWGKMIFESNDITKSWNGMFNNETVPNGIYSYHLVWQGMDKSRKATYTRFGTVTVLK